ncbi:hypothetical protein [Winogradskyella sp.]|uniref:hypothetical protein n=1 Tax=Winogradskyella sp. TaxID=1883156 RepID=UPI0025D2556F|nr:hypothetical protein [Winogradskyella sp.]
MNFKTVITSIFRVLALILVLAVLLPSVVKLTHAFNHHTHEVCESDNEATTHFHESDLECDFYKFKLTKNQFFVLSKYEKNAKFQFSKQKLDYYISFNNYQQLTRFLRGPPQLV